ncbi:MAG: hypothetical protein NTY36_05520, partial [Deltaproteobacteria bacterium]|nr:hypothetical protein [Deltaproteobacteria bacterium]
ATTTGLIEIDFDPVQDPRQSNTSSYSARLRHAMFRLNWPETELMLGQYWTMFCEYTPENAQDTPLNNHGMPSGRVPQIRLTQKFAGNWTVAAAILKPYDPSTADAAFDGQVLTAPGGAPVAPPAGVQSASVGLPGQSSEIPHIDAKIAYEKDLYGKAGFFGRPRGFAAQVTAGWQQIRYRANTAAQAFGTFGQNAYSTNTGFQRGQQYLDPWMVQANLFIPVLPTYSANLAGTASLSAQWFIGQGLSAFGEAQDSDASWFKFTGIGPTGSIFFNRILMNQFGGYLQGQYYFTNQWFLNAVWGMQRSYGIESGASAALARTQGANNPYGYMYATLNDQVKLWQEFDLTLWYRPIEAIKFGLQYTYGRTDYLQKVNNPQSLTGVGPLVPGQVQGQPSAGAKDFGEAHRVQFVAFMFF